jgi:hypothetical protein
MQILTAEHSSLTAMRSQVQAEMASRASMFVAALAGGLVALSFIAQATRFGPESRAFDLTILPVLLFLGLTTFVRTLDLSADDVRWAAGLNRIRRAYVELEPHAERYLTAGDDDDIEGILATLNPGRSNSPLYGIVATPGVVAVINGVLAAAIVAILASTLAPGLAIPPVLLLGALAFGIVLALQGVYGSRVFGRAMQTRRDREVEA